MIWFTYYWDLLFQKDDSEFHLGVLNWSLLFQKGDPVFQKEDPVFYPDILRSVVSERWLSVPSWRRYISSLMCIVYERWFGLCSRRTEVYWGLLFQIGDSMFHPDALKTIEVCCFRKLNWSSMYWDQLFQKGDSVFHPVLLEEVTLAELKQQISQIFQVTSHYWISRIDRWNFVPSFSLFDLFWRFWKLLSYKPISCKNGKLDFI